MRLYGHVDMGRVKTAVTITNHLLKMFRSHIHKAEHNTAARMNSEKLTETNS